MKFHLKGGCGVQAIRWSFVGVCFVLFICSVSVLTISAVNYAEMRVAFDEVGSQRKYDFNPNYVFHKFKPEAALGIFYFGMTIGTIFTLISCIGSCGAAILDRCFLIVFVVSLSVVLFGSIITLAVIANILRDDLQAMAEDLYKGFVNHFYGRGDLFLKMMTGVIDSIQRTHECCGVLEAIDKQKTKEIYGTWPAHYTALYWLESTQWGQIQANGIGYDENRWIRWTPDSCCRSPSSNCSWAQFGARLDDWSEAKEEEWTQRINAKGCGAHLLDFNHIEATDRAKLIALTIFGIIVLLTTIVLACWLCQAISAYEYSSRDSELDQRRHRRRRRPSGHRKHRRHRSRMGTGLLPADVIVVAHPSQSTPGKSDMLPMPVAIFPLSAAKKTATSEPILPKISQNVITPVLYLAPAATPATVTAPSALESAKQLKKSSEAESIPPAHHPKPPEISGE